MAERMGAAQRIRLQNVAEAEVLKYKGNHAMWHKHVHNVELDAVQVLKMEEMDQHSNTIDFSSRRTGKTACKELYDLEQVATNADQELGIVAPREAQAITNLNYHLEAIRRSEILTAYLAYKSGRYQLSDTKYELFNRSKASSYGIMSQVDGGDLTMASLEEVDDMPRERLYSRFLLMLGSSRRLGASKESKNDPQIRITGVFKGADTLTDLLNMGSYYVVGAFHGDAAKAEIKRLIDDGWLQPEEVELATYKYPVPILNAVNGMDLNMLQRAFIMDMRADLSRDEFIRQLLCINTSSRNLVWEVYMRKAMQKALEDYIKLVIPQPGITYKKRGLVSLGYDHLGHGEKTESSRSALVILEQVGIYVVLLYCREWAPGTDEGIIRNDLLEIWRYFQPDGAIGDAYGIGLLTQVNDDLFKAGLTAIDRRTIGDGESTASTWPEWAFSPLRFEGMVKHQMAQAVRNTFHSKHGKIPYFDDLLDVRDDEIKDPDVVQLRKCCRQITNIKPVQSNAAYSLYHMVDSKVGDDYFDAYMAALWCLVTRGAGIVETIIQSVTRSREKVLGPGRRRLPSEPIKV